MKKTIMIFLTLIMILVLIGCNKSSDEDTRKNESTSKSGITTKESSSNIDVTDNSEKLENSEVVDEITNENEALEPVVLTEEQKNKLVKLYMKSNFYFCASEDIDVPIPLELRITEKIDEYDSVCYSVYEYGNDKFYAFLFREKYDPKKSVFYSSKTVYEKFFLIPMDKIYTMDDFKDIEINQIYLI